MGKKCSVCGGKADIVVKVHMQGFVKEIAYCKRCLKRSLNTFQNDSLHLSLDTWSMINSRPRLNVKMEVAEVDSVSFLSESIKSTLGIELKEQEKVNYEISRLRRKMAKAISNENYELAGILQREIKRLKSIFKKAK